MTGHAGAIHPKDAFIDEFKQLEERKRATFAGKFIDRIFGAGFGVLSKREIELAILALMTESGMLAGYTNNELSLALGISEIRVRGMRLAAMLRYGVDQESYLRNRLPELLTQMSPKLVKAADGAETVRFVVEDALLQQAFNAQVKLADGIPERDPNPEVCQVRLDVFTKVVAGLLPVELQDELKRKFKGKWHAKLTELIKKSIGHAASTGVNAAIAAGTVPALAMVWNFALEHTDWLTELTKALA